MSSRLEELQHKCRTYHFKKSVKFFGTLVLLLSLPTAAYYLYDLLIQAPNEKGTVSIVQAKTQIKEQESTASNNTLSPSYVLSVLPDAVEKSVTNIQSQRPPENKPAVEMKMQSVHTDKQKVLTIEAVHSEVKQVPRKSYFTEVNADKPIEDWIEKYNHKKSYALAIYISKQYYFDNDYKQAGIWAKRANQLDRNQEEAWLLYAKSVYALDNREKAVRILNIYLQYKKSSKAEFLLSEWSN